MNFATPKKYITLTLVFALIFSLPIGAGAVDVIPPIPVSDSVIRDKEAGITIFGFTVPGITWDSILIMIVKAAISSIVQSTVTWINNGFDGNPAFVTNPGQYFTNVADTVTGEFIVGSDLGFLCSPFQTKIRLALQRSHNRRYRQFQCTLTGVVGNIEAFYNNFSQGGWEGWFAMTQNDANNPYGAFLTAQIEMDSRVANALGIKKQQLDWGLGFLSLEKCPAGSQEITDEEGFYGSGRCATSDGREVRKQTATPGTVINEQLEGVLGTGLRQLELADEFDELVSALVGQLLQQVVFSAKGLFSGSLSDPPPPPPPSSFLSVSCSPSPDTIIRWESTIWTASASGGTRPYTFAWSDSDGGSFNSGTIRTWERTYTRGGIKNAAVVVRDSRGQMTSASCRELTVISPTGSITASPNPCSLGSATTCGSYITWETENSPEAEVWVSVNGASETLFRRQASCSGTECFASFIPESPQNAVFRIYHFSSGIRRGALDTVTVTGQR